MKSNFHPSTSINNKQLWDEFKEKYPEYKGIYYREFAKLMNEFWAFCGDILVENLHGLILNGIGYFSNTVFMKKKVKVMPKKSYINYHSEGDIYATTVFPRVFGSNPFNSWSFRTVRGVKNRLIENYKKGVKYKNHYELIGKSKKHKFYLKDEQRV